MYAFIKLYDIFDWNENKIDINLFITQFATRFFLYLPGSSHTDDPGKYKKSLIS